MGSRRQLVLYHDQLRAAGQKPTVPDARRARSDAPYRWRCCARCHEIQSREIHLALPPVPAYAGSSACDHRVSARTRHGNVRQELEKVRRWKTWRGLATRFLRPQVARSSRAARENQLHPDESGSQRIVRAPTGLVVGLSSKRPPAAALVGRAVLCAPRRKSRRTARTHSTSLRAGCDAPYQTFAHRYAGFRSVGARRAARTGVRALPSALTNTLI